LFEKILSEYERKHIEKTYWIYTAEPIADIKN
jgi:hypothetical protein